MAQITTTEFAAALETDARTARKFLRSITPKDEQPGKGSRWVLEGNKTSLNKMRKQFNEWSAAQAEKKAEKDSTEPVADEVDNIDLEDEEMLDEE